MNKFKVKYMYRGQKTHINLNDWISVILFVEETENEYGGYVYAIDVDDRAYFFRCLDHDLGTDYWTDYNGDEVTLEQQFRERV